MIRQGLSSVHADGPTRHKARETHEEPGLIYVIREDGRPLDALHHDMVQGAGSIQPGPAEQDGAQASTSGTSGATLRAFPNESLKSDRNGSVL